MLIQIAIGTLLIFSTIVIQVVFVSIATHNLIQRGPWLVKPPFMLKTTVGLVAVILWLIIGISLSAWAWAGAFILTGAFEQLEPALYFSIVTFTTLGYGDITVAPQWRIMASFAAVNGLIIFGLNTAFLVEFSNRLRTAQESNENHPVSDSPSVRDHGK